MSASGGNETALLGSFARKQVKYGSTCKYVSRSGKTIKHVVQPGDTLQGIALRYGVTTEELKRANRLWTSDSLFLRTWLAVPVVEAGPAVGGASASAGRDTNGGDRAGSEDTPLQSDESIADFLGRIDNSIAKSRSQLRQLSHTRRGRSQMMPIIALTVQLPLPLAAGLKVPKSHWNTRCRSPCPLEPSV
ncbi:hypothetical protein HPB49_026449 [Dermacentor silvarum]|nr:hypothetical protein HPB49_026449 [Dermacentor silvarum]